MSQTLSPIGIGHEQAVRVSLKFLKWQELYEIEKPFQIFIDIPKDAEDQRNTNLVFEAVDINIFNVRDCLQDLSIDTHGFMYRTHPTALKEFTDRPSVEALYLPEVEKILRDELDDVDRLRKSVPEVERSAIDLNDLTAWLRPATMAHVDQSPAAALKRIKLQLGDDAEFLIKGRVRIVNVWRPLEQPVTDWPIAVCDARTVSPSDLVECDHVRRQYTGSTMYLQHNLAQRFYYLDRQSKDEVLIFKNFDSARAVAKYAPHASFQLPNLPIKGHPRESIEVRAFAFTYPKI